MCNNLKLVIDTSANLSVNETVASCHTGTYVYLGPKQHKEIQNNGPKFNPWSQKFVIWSSKVEVREMAYKLAVRLRIENALAGVFSLNKCSMKTNN